VKRKQLAVFLMLGALLAGCSGAGALGENPDRAETDTQNAAEAEDTGEADAETEDTKETGTEAEDTEGTGADGDRVSAIESGEDNSGEIQKSVLPEGIRRGRMLMEDEEAFYCCGTGQIRRIGKAEGETRILWEKDAGAEENPSSMDGSGILLGDNLYFLEESQREAEDGYGRGLSVVKTDGSGYRRITGLEDYPDIFYCYDGALYLEADGYVRSCPLTDDGRIQDGEGMQEVHLEKVPEDYHLVNARHSGSRYLGALESLNTFGYYLMENRDMELAAIDPGTGEEKLLPAKGRLRAFNQDYFLFSDYGDGREELYLLDTDFMGAGQKAGEDSGMRLLTVFEEENYQSGIMVLDMDEEHVYIVAENPAGEPEEDSVYEEIDLETGERRELFRLSRRLGMEGSYSFYDRSMAFQEGYAYYADAQDYKIYLMRRSLEETGKAEVLGEPVYDSGISRVGRVESYFERVNSEVRPDFVLLEMDLERLVVDEKFEGAQEINRVLTEYQQGIISYKKNEEEMKWQESELAALEEDVTPYSLSFSYTSYPSEISYFDGNTFSFRQMDYDYTGGAHGMPYWEGFTFDLHTGERLLLSDVIGNSEEELKAVVVRYFDEYMSKTPDGFWEDALKVVEEGTGFSSHFYLTQDGIRFYFEPYALASYAAGFQEVTIPYDEFEMKIPLGN